MTEENRYPQTIENERELGPTQQPGSLADPGTQAGGAIADTGREMASFVSHFAGAASAEAAVGPVQSVGGHTLVPLASVSMQGGFGMGFGGGGDSASQHQSGGSGGGAGGGGRGSARVIAIADVSESGVVVRPVPDVTALALGLMALVGLAMLRRRGGGAERRRLMGLLQRDGA
jgi:uncharacterized spore protein YtfJ